MGTHFKPTSESTRGATLVTDFVYDLVESLRVRQASWGETLGFAPAGLMPNLTGRIPVNVSVPEIKKKDGEGTFRGMNDLFIPYDIEDFYSGMEESPKRLLDPSSGLILQWEAAPKAIAKKWSTFTNKKIAALLAAGAASGAVWTKGANFFAASGHHYNPKDTSLGSFGNYLSGGGALSATPWYMIGGGPGWTMYPWGIFRGEGDPPAQNAGSFRMSDGVNVTVFDYASEHYAKHSTLRIKTEASYGFCLLHPQSIVRSEAAITYEGVKAAVNALRVMKDLDGDQASDDMSMTILAPKALLTDFEAVLNREMVSDGTTTVTNDLRTKGIKLVGLAS